ncbi:MAG: hypothetical protein KC613_06080 [Myxococcales bacterium]|nr:hypothetical protein [Myxococcales bacterium]MCB9524392.1 hypothetical protein [Myxococcales bacterium]
MPRPAQPLWFALWASLVLAACGAEVGEGSVVGSLLIPLCEGGEAADYVCTPEATCDAFDLGVDFFALETLGERVIIRLQRGGRSLGETDGLVIDIPQRGALTLGTPLPVGPDGPVRVGLAVHGRCPESPQSFRLTGTVVFEAFGTAGGDRVSAAFEALEVHDGRTDARLGLLRGAFDFRVAKGSTRQRYVDL